MSTLSPGRRVAERRRHGPTRGALMGALLVAVAATLLVAAGLVQAAPEASPRATSVPVEQATTACLGWPKGPAGQGATLAAPLPGAGGAGSGRLTVGALSEKGTAEPVGRSGQLRSLDAPGQGEALVVSATGGAGVGRVTFQTDRAGRAGVAVQECLEPRSTWWFTGGGADLDHRAALVLGNVDPGPAVVDVVVQGPAGIADDVGTRGITLAAGEIRTIDLVDVAPQADELQVHVHATRGRVVAGLADGFATRPAAEPGREWIPGQTEPVRLLRLSPLPRLADERTLVLANPSPDREALVEVRVSGASGSFVPTGLEAVRVPAQSVKTEDLGRAVGRGSAAVVLRSPVPVTATVRSVRGRDVSYAAPAPELDGPAAAILASGADAEVQLMAGARAARATVTAYSAQGRKVDSTDLKVPPAATVVWSPKGQPAYVVVDPVEGRPSGGVSMSSAGVSQVVLQPLPLTLEQPPVVPVVR